MELMRLLMLLIGGVMLGMEGEVRASSSPMVAPESQIISVVNMNFLPDYAPTDRFSEREKQARHLVNCTVWQRYWNGSSSLQSRYTHMADGDESFHDCFIRCHKDWQCMGFDWSVPFDLQSCITLGLCDPNNLESYSSIIDSHRCDIYRSDFDLRSQKNSTQYRRLNDTECPAFTYYETEMCCNVDRLYGYRGIVEAADYWFIAEDYFHCRSKCVSFAWFCFAFDFENNTGLCHLYNETYSRHVVAYEWAAFYLFIDCDEALYPKLPREAPENCLNVDVALHTRVPTEEGHETDRGSANLQMCMEECRLRQNCVAIQFDDRSLPVDNGVRCYTFNSTPATETIKENFFYIRVNDDNCIMISENFFFSNCTWRGYHDKGGLPTIGTPSHKTSLAECMEECKTLGECWAVDFTQDKQCIQYQQQAAYWLTDRPGTKHYVRTRCTYPDKLPKEELSHEHEESETWRQKSGSSSSEEEQSGSVEEEETVGVEDVPSEEKHGVFESIGEQDESSESNKFD